MYQTARFSKLDEILGAAEKDEPDDTSDYARRHVFDLLSCLCSVLKRRRSTFEPYNKV